jgi:hypothetical protein
MTDFTSPLQVVLQQAGYQTWMASISGIEAVCFEDDAVMGFACIFEDAATLLAEWRKVETMWLTKHGPSLHKAGEKTWNVYSVFLAANSADPVQMRELRAIEEDLERTRKITGHGLSNRSDFIAAVLPLLPLQYQPVLDSEDFDLTQRLRKRIATIAPTAADAALDDAVSPSEVVRLLGAEL